MKIGILSDIHANDLALEAVLAAATREGVEQLLLAGDYVGYYFSPRRVLALLAPWKKSMVRGNHEEMLALARDDPDQLAQFEPRYGSGLRIALEELSVQQIEMLVSLPHPLQLTIDGVRILLCHGAPWNISQYVYPDSRQELFVNCAVPSFDMVIMGHTHFPMLAYHGATMLVNPGSVGQPRHGRAGAHWALFDTETRNVAFHVETYDAQKLANEVRRRHPEKKRLANILLTTD